MKTTLLLDADIIAYKVAALNQEDYDFGDTGSARVLNHEHATRHTDELIAEYCSALKTQNVVVCLSDPERNFRKELYPAYKEHRKQVEKPELLLWVKEYLYREYRSYLRPRLEADDCMAILATHPKLLEGRKIIVSEDKDMRTIPGNVYNPDRPELGVLDISEEDANRFLCWQTIVGDATDGYPGCPGIGPSPLGPRSFGFPDEVLECDYEDIWDVVLTAYGSKGLTETDAILQARLAYMLRWYSFNYKTKRVKLWHPEMLALT